MFLPPGYICNRFICLQINKFYTTFVKQLITSMNNRLKQFLAAENITQSQFADKIDVVRASVSHVLSGRNNPSYEFIKAIMANYPSLNIEWLMFGKGKMYKGAEDTLPHVPPQPSGQIAADDYHEDLLFNDLYSEEEVVENNEATPVVNPDSPSEATIPISLLKTLTQTGQSANKQRKVSKIIVLFDDGSYQEL